MKIKKIIVNIIAGITLVGISPCFINTIKNSSFIADATNIETYK